MYEPDDDFVRPPDHVVCERLLGGDLFEYMPVSTRDDEADTDQEYMRQVMKSIEDEYALEQIAEFERKERETHFVESKRIFVRLSHMDKINSDIYTTALSTILLYEECNIMHQPMNSTEYQRFADILSKIRIPKEEYERWNTLVTID
jgi:hypothetical protein